MEPEEIGDIILLPLIFLAFIDFEDFLITHYTVLKHGIPQLYIDALFFVLAIPIYAYVAKKVVYEHKGDAEDAGIVTFILSFTKWLIGWAMAIFFYFVVATGSQTIIPSSTTFTDPIARMFSFRTMEMFLWHVVGAGIGGNVFGWYFEKQKEEES